MSPEEYRLLSDQKAADYRSFVQLNPGLLAVTGAIFAAGLTQKSTIAIVLSPLPLLLAVFQLVRNAELQLQLATYLDVFAPAEGGSWERDIAVVRPRYWDQQPQRCQFIRRASGWNVWVWAGLTISETIAAFPWLAHIPHGRWAFVLASAAYALPAPYLVRTSQRIERKRGEWQDLWTEYRDESPGPVGGGAA
jgi:hypothetical protein